MRRLTLLLLLALATPLEAQEWKTSILPVLGSAPETGGQYGIALLRTRQPADSLGTRPTSMMGNAVRTEKAQTRLFLDTDWWTPGNAWRFTTNSVWQEFPLAYYGFGDRASETDRLNYTPRTLELAVAVQRRVAEGRWVMASLRRIETELVKSDSVMSDVLPASYFTIDDLAPSAQGRHMLATIGYVGDSRDNLFAPTRGHFVEATMGVANTSIGSEFDYTRLRVDARAYRPLGAGVLAGQFVLLSVDGEAPFDQVAVVGNSSSMRGYTLGRFRDRRAVSAQVEYRSRDRGRWGGALFAGGTMIAPDFGALGDARLLPSVGGGVRFRMDPVTRSAIRVDYAIGASGQSGLYVSFNEAF